MAQSYSNVPVEDVMEVVSQTRRRRAVAVGLVCIVVVGYIATQSAPFDHRLRGASFDDETELMLIKAKETAKCAKLWEQCGGDGYDGPTCCEDDNECQHKPLDNYESYHQCRKPPPRTCGDPALGSTCASMVQQIKGDASSNPQNYHGLTGDMHDKEFQQFLHWAGKDESGCPAPCEGGGGTCYFNLHVEGCDTLHSWYCDRDDGSLKYACCCKYFNEEKALEKPTEIDEDMAKAMEAAASTNVSLFCVAMVQPKGYELGLLRAQYAQGGLGLFACNDWSLYSNVSLRITPEDQKPEIRTGLINGSLSATMGGDWGTALNTDVFIRFWDRVIADKKAWSNDWVVKVDPDTMWLPERLRALLVTSHGPLGEPEPEKGLFLNNCHVGLHGPIEVMSGNALHTYKKHRKECQEGNVGKIGQEDYWLRKCFEKIGIMKVDAYNLMLEATLACQEVASAEDPDRPPCFSAQVAFHPFKTIDTWMHCHKQAANHPWALPVIPVTDGPSEANNRHG